jgi:hypothetical protein
MSTICRLKLVRTSRAPADPTVGRTLRMDVVDLSNNEYCDLLDPTHSVEYVVPSDHTAWYAIEHAIGVLLRECSNKCTVCMGPSTEQISELFANSNESVIQRYTATVGSLRDETASARQRRNSGFIVL